MTSESKCSHLDHIDLDPSGRQVCHICGEVLESEGRLVQEEFDSRPEFQFIPKLSSFGTSICYDSTSLIDEVCRDIEKASGTHFSPELKQRVMRIVEAYRRSLETGQVHSYENLVRTAAWIVLRETGSIVPSEKVLSRFDDKRVPAYRLLVSLCHRLNIVTEIPDWNALLQHVCETIWNNVQGTQRLSSKSDFDAFRASSTALLQELVNLEVFPTFPKLSHVIACVYYCLRFGNNLNKNVTLRECIVACDMSSTEKTIYRDYELLRKFIKDSYLRVGIRQVDHSAFLKNMEELCSRMKMKQEIRKRLRKMTSD
jgi:hypothetical protein